MEANDQYEALINDQELLKKRSVRLVYNTLIYARDTGREDVITNFINYIKETGIRRMRDRLILFLFDPTYRNEENYQLIMNDISNFNLEQLYVAFEVMNYKIPDSNVLESFSMNYEYQLENSIKDGIIADTNFEQRVRMECLMPKDLGEFLIFLYNDNQELYDKVISIIKNKNLKVELYDCVNLHIFEKISNQTYVFGIPLERIKKMLMYLQDKLGIAEIDLNDFDACYKIYHYYNKTQDKNIYTEFIEYIRMQIPKPLEVDLEALPSKSEIKIWVNKKEQLESFIEYFNSIGRNDITIFLDFKMIDNNEEIYEMFKKVRHKDNVIFKITDDDIKDGSMTLTEYIKAHEFYEITAQTIKEYNFTPLEAYIYVYQFVKSFKQYRYYKDDSELDYQYSEMSRNPYIIVGNSYIVCAGFANMAAKILNLINIPSASLLVEMTDEIYSNPNHARVLLHLKDDFYGIDSIFIGDPTFDNLSPDEFKYILMNIEQKHDVKDNLPEIVEILNRFHLISDEDYYQTWRREQLLLQNESLLKMVNQTVRPDKLLYAFRNVLTKTNPNLTPEEVENIIEKIFTKSEFEGYVPHIDLNRNLSQYINENNNFEINNYFCHYLQEGLSMQRYGKVHAPNSLTCFALQLIDTRLTQGQIDEILQKNQFLFTNPYVFYGISEYFPREPAITLTFPPETSIGDMIEIIQELCNNLNKIFSLNILDMEAMESTKSKI